MAEVYDWEQEGSFIYDWQSTFQEERQSLYGRSLATRMGSKLAYMASAIIAVGADVDLINAQRANVQPNKEVLLELGMAVAMAWGGSRLRSDADLQHAEAYELV